MKLADYLELPICTLANGKLHCSACNSGCHGAGVEVGEQRKSVAKCVKCKTIHRLLGSHRQRKYLFA